VSNQQNYKIPWKGKCEDPEERQCITGNWNGKVMYFHYKLKLVILLGSHACTTTGPYETEIHTSYAHNQSPHFTPTFNFNPITQITAQHIILLPLSISYPEGESPCP